MNSAEEGNISMHAISMHFYCYFLRSTHVLPAKVNPTHAQLDDDFVATSIWQTEQNADLLAVALPRELGEIVQDRCSTWFFLLENTEIGNSTKDSALIRRLFVRRSNTVSQF